jgi:cytochrome d ubiquinol oxidase subunit I
MSALWILIANGWMQFPIGSQFNIDTMRMEVTNFADVVFNPVAQAKFVHTISAGYVAGSMFVLAISAWFMLQGRHIEIAKRSMTVALSFGLASALSVVVLGDESGYTAGQNQKMKIAAIEAMWHTEVAPADFTVFGVPDLKTRTTHFEIKLPWLLGLIATRSIDTPVPGIVDIVNANEGRIKNGLIAYDALDKLRHDHGNPELLAQFKQHQADLGYALLLKRYRPDVVNATSEQIKIAAADTIPNVPLLFWSFRCMVGVGFYLVALFAYGFYLASRRQLHKTVWFQKLALFSLPLPWLAIELGWIVAECGRQPWSIDGVLPTFLSASSISAGQVWTSLIGFVLFYSALLIVDVVLLLKYIRLGPALGTMKEEAA